MKYFLCFIVIFFLYGCSGSSPSPHTDKSIKATQEIQNNISEAQKAREEYLALQRNRHKMLL